MSQIAWSKGGMAWLIELEGDRASFSSDVPSPPGSRIEGVVVSDASLTLRVKIHRSKKKEDGSFFLEGRLLDMPREVRERLAAHAKGGDLASKRNPA